MKILFVNPCLRYEVPRHQLPVGLGYVLTAVKKAGYEFDLYDMDINRFRMEDYESYLASRPAYDIVAFGCIVTGYDKAKQLAAISRAANPKCVIVAGNSVASSIPEITLLKTEVDIACLGESDITIVELLERLTAGEPWEDVPGLAFARGGEVVFSPRRKVIENLDTVPFVDWEIFDLQRYMEKSKINVNISRETIKNDIVSFPLNTARGCMYRCSFCYHVYRKDRYRQRSPENIVAEIKELNSKYDANFISFWDELTLSSIKQSEQLADSIINSGLKIYWDGTARGDLFTEEHLGVAMKLKESGCDSLSYSLEHANEEILKSMNKRMSLAQFEEQKRTLDKAGIPSLTSIFFGTRLETPETIRETIEFCRKVGLYPSAGFLLPQPGTPVYDEALKAGFIGDEEEYLIRIADRQDLHINLTKMSDETLFNEVFKGLRYLSDQFGLNIADDRLFKTSTYQFVEIPK